MVNEVGDSRGFEADENEAVILGAEELAAGEVPVRDLDRGHQERVALDRVADSVKRITGEPPSRRTA